MDSFMQKIGVWAFLIGLVVALVAAFISADGLGSTTTWVLAFLGIIVGLINVVDKEIKLYLLAAITFMISASSLGIVFPSGVFNTFLNAVIVFVAPGAAVVSLRALYDIAKAK